MRSQGEFMTSIDEYRGNAEDCLRMAAEDDRDKPLWVTLAQSWLRLAEHAARIDANIQSGELPVSESASSQS
jgi:hypothetical protein